METQRALVRRLSRIPEDDMLFTPARLYLSEQQLVYDFQQLNKFTSLGLDELNIPKKSTIRPHSAPPVNLDLIWTSQARLFSYIKALGLKVVVR